MDDTDNIVSIDGLISEEPDTYFKNATKSLHISKSISIDTEDQVKKVIFKYTNHLGVILIKNKTAARIICFY